MSRAVCPGSFDPVTLGHVDIVARTSHLFDEVVVAVGINDSKRVMFNTAERVALLEEVLGDLANVRVMTFSGLLVDFCTAHGIQAVVKGLRAVSDFDYELQMAQMNSTLARVDTLFMPTSPEYSFLASSLVKEVARHGGDVSPHVPPVVLAALERKLAAEG
ncbi:pantetheine-phosphate adenylyltransferase [Mumia sp. zg.B53]|uniref:pantetheine-phosphate adenylyltransferase n=1 Tax=unclassified Mumia TaxID=2621872 RepID=UPI001C6E416B|nr:MULTISPECIES: pantetheine-phosphate adenylyltransferase [unclassified Mumia]MBW9206396.1 pantetheine-phosphate adenylyltransferase [Mumia sp. zg.B17]MBW9211314.1 pantetheine-phosphate adenylyltransferase [Mumia sp. zg.B21]MBW9215889.1 pantetheine-phosphate adenylyltransferase [Mumia sp. zg.B53]MDD9348039.1 pantetheine-phosphate adenylyltransferase [Mumia sp.]